MGVHRLYDIRSLTKVDKKTALKYHLGGLQQWDIFQTREKGVLQITVTGFPKRRQTTPNKDDEKATSLG